MQPARNLVGAVLELAARMELRQNHLGRGDLFRRVPVHGDAAPVVRHPHRAVFVDRHAHLVAVAGHRFVHAVVHHLVYEMVQASGTRAADVHGGPFPHRFQAFEDADVFRLVARVRHVFGGSRHLPVAASLGCRCLIYSFNPCVSNQEILPLNLVFSQPGFLCRRDERLRSQRTQEQQHSLCPARIKL